MQGLPSFKDLPLEEKRDHIWRMVAPLVANQKSWRRYLECFISTAIEEKLDSFYNAVKSWDKEYFEKVINDLKSKGSEMKKIKKEFSFEVMKHKEQKEKIETEKEIDDQLQDI